MLDCAQLEELQNEVFGSPRNFLFGGTTSQSDMEKLSNALVGSANGTGSHLHLILSDPEFFASVANVCVSSCPAGVSRLCASLWGDSTACDRMVDLVSSVPEGRVSSEPRPSDPTLRRGIEGPLLVGCLVPLLLWRYLSLRFSEHVRDTGLQPCSVAADHHSTKFPPSGSSTPGPDNPTPATDSLEGVLLHIVDFSRRALIPTLRTEETSEEFSGLKFGDVDVSSHKQPPGAPPPRGRASRRKPKLRSLEQSSAATPSRAICANLMSPNNFADRPGTAHFALTRFSPFPIPLTSTPKAAAPSTSYACSWSDLPVLILRAMTTFQIIAALCWASNPTIARGFLSFCSGAFGFEFHAVQPLPAASVVGDPTEAASEVSSCGLPFRLPVDDQMLIEAARTCLMIWISCPQLRLTVQACLDILLQRAEMEVLIHAVMHILSVKSITTRGGSPESYKGLLFDVST